MQQLHIQLEDWQQAALSEMAQSHGIAMETLAKSILSERLVERIHTAFDDLLSGDTALIISDVSDVSSVDTIEQRLRRLFDA